MQQCVRMVRHQCSVGLLLALMMATPAAATVVRGNPLGSALDLLGQLSVKVMKEGEVEAKAYDEYFSWCDEVSRNTKFEITTASAKKEKLEASVAKLSSDIEAADAKVEDLAAAVATGSGQLADATLIREKEAADFAANEKELVEVIDTLGRAVGLIGREMQKNPAAMTQTGTASTASLLQSLSAVVDAAGFSNTDRQRLLALVQSQQQGTDEEAGELGAPAAAVYKTQSGGILDTLEDLKDKAEEQLASLRKAETSSKHNYEMLKQSLEDQKAADEKDKSEEAAGKSAAAEAKAGDEADLSKTTEELTAAKASLESANTGCMQTAADHEATVKAREEELKVIAEAVKVLQETSAGATGRTYSLLQVRAASATKLQTQADLARLEVVALVKQLAKKHHSAALAQLASRIDAVVRFGGAGRDGPFAKVKGLIQDMIMKLEAEAGAEASEKAYCDEETAKTEAKKAELEEDISKLTAKIDQAAAKSGQLKEEVKELMEELAALAAEQAEMDKIRKESSAAYIAAKADLELGLSGLRKALSVLREYYGTKIDEAALLQDDQQMSALMQQPAVPELHAKSSGAGTSIIGLLEVVESDFATNLAKEETQESDAAAEYEKTTQENKVTKALKDQDVKYKTEESKSLDKSIAELSADRESTNSELAAILEYYGKLKERCIAKPETYEARKARREAEISGLKEALEILKSETAVFLQRRHPRSIMRGAALVAR